MIRVLAPEVVAQIAAGEVVERPFSVVKELVENALDAGATRVRIEIDGGGVDRIRIVDDGRGFTPADLELAFVSHATSKLATLSDLDHILSLGFRGEALASIGSVARARICSRPTGAADGHEVECIGGAISAVRPAACPPGSNVEIRDLFFNVPARRRFLRTPHAERARIHELLTRLSLGRLDVDWTLVADGRELLRLPAGQTLLDRIRAAFGNDVARALRPVERVAGRLRVDGFVADPDGARRDASLEVLLVNGRVVRERSVTAAIKTAFRDHLVHGRHPVWFLHLTMPPSDVDVNVHPTKAEVRFVDQRKVAGTLHDVVRELLVGRAATPLDALSIDANLPRARSGFPDLPADLFGRPVSPPLPGSLPSNVRERAPTFAAASTAPPSSPPSASSPAPSPNPFVDLRDRFLQVHDLYLVFETAAGLTIVDQHALHERVIYERLRRRDAERGVAIQRLLVPDVVEVQPSDKAWLLEHRAALAGEGFLLDDFGGPAIAIHGIPAVLARSSPRRLLETFLRADGETDARPSTHEAVVERFHSMACRGAVMSGDRLADDEIRALLADAAVLEHPHHCPHGRPTTVTFARSELERYFRRRV